MAQRPDAVSVVTQGLLDPARLLRPEGAAVPSETQRSDLSEFEQRPSGGGGGYSSYSSVSEPSPAAAASRAAAARKGGAPPTPAGGGYSSALDNSDYVSSDNDGDNDGDDDSKKSPKISLCFRLVTRPIFRREIKKRARKFFFQSCQNELI